MAMLRMMLRMRRLRTENVVGGLWSAPVRDDINRRWVEPPPLNAMDVVASSFQSKTIICAAVVMQTAHFSAYNCAQFSSRFLSVSTMRRRAGAAKLCPGVQNLGFQRRKTPVESRGRGRSPAGGGFEDKVPQSGGNFPFSLSGVQTLIAKCKHLKQMYTYVYTITALSALSNAFYMSYVNALRVFFINCAGYKYTYLLT